jgi:uroporphyrinogen-III synthase
VDVEHIGGYLGGLPARETSLAGCRSTLPVRSIGKGESYSDARNAVINEMAAGQIDAIAFTSAPQVRRFRDVARALGRGGAARSRTHRRRGSGPIVAAELNAIRVQVNVTPVTTRTS